MVKSRGWPHQFIFYLFNVLTSSDHHQGIVVPSILKIIVIYSLKKKKSNNKIKIQICSYIIVCIIRILTI